MANIILTSNSEFKPFTFEERIAPYLMISQAGEKLAEKYDAIEEEIFTLEKLAESEVDKDSQAARKYRDYANRLRMASEQLDTDFSPSSYSTFRELRRGYLKDIAPISEAWEARKKAQEEALKAEAEGLHRVSSLNPFTTSIDAYMSGSPQVYHSYLDKNQQSAAATIQGITSNYYNDPILGSRFGDAFKTITESIGMTPEALSVLFGGIDMNNPIQSLRSYNGEFKEVAQGIANELEKAGYGRFDNVGNQQVFNSVINGAMQGLVYKKDIQMVQNPNYMSPEEKLQWKASMNATYGKDWETKLKNGEQLIPQDKSGGSDKPKLYDIPRTEPASYYDPNIDPMVFSVDDAGSDFEFEDEGGMDLDSKLTLYNKGNFRNWKSASYAYIGNETETKKQKEWIDNLLAQRGEIQSQLDRYGLKKEDVIFYYEDNKVGDDNIVIEYDWNRVPSEHDIDLAIEALKVSGQTTTESQLKSEYGKTRADLLNYLQNHYIEIGPTSGGIKQALSKYLYLNKNIQNLGL